MDFLLQSAHAANGSAAADGGSMMGLLFPILILVIFYFLFIRPQQKRMKEHRQMVSELKKGDEVVTNGGLAGQITEVGESFLQIEFAEGVEIRVQKQAVANVLPRGTLKD